QAVRKSAPTLLFAKRLIASHGSILPFAKACIIYMARPGQMTFASSTERQDNNSSHPATSHDNYPVSDTATLPYDYNHNDYNNDHDYHDYSHNDHDYYNNDYNHNDYNNDDDYYYNDYNDEVSSLPHNCTVPDSATVPNDYHNDEVSSLPHNYTVSDSATAPNDYHNDEVSSYSCIAYALKQ
ncbi:hypothetical protein FOZ63_004594, partial [Perkinsus olseni]